MIYTLPHILEQSAAQFPSKEAFRFLSESISFKELDTKACQLAKHLIDQGVKKGDRIGIYMNRCLETSIAIYGILKSGCAYVPLDPFAPIERTKLLIRDCGIQILVTTKNQKKKSTKLLDSNSNLRYFIGIENNEICSSVPWETIFSLSLEGYEPANVLEQDLAYILYTSGSTGIPKGIMHTHYSALNFAKLVIDHYKFSSYDKIAITAPLHFDPSALGYFSSPLVGATCVIISDAHLNLPASLAEIMEKEQLTVCYTVPLVLIQLLQNGGLERRNFDSLQWVLFSGEVFPTKHLRSLMDLWPNKMYSNIYGPTELNHCTNYNFKIPPTTDEPIPIGSVWGNTEFKILDENDKEVAFGQTGLLVIRSGTQMKGYWNNEALTAKALYKETIAPGMDKIYYRTGDVVQQNEKGQLLFLGRNDRQIKIRGYRVEIDEIEKTLLRNAGIREAAVVLIDKEGEKFLSAVVILSENAKIDENEIFAFCKKQLPLYAVPSFIKIQTSLPRTSSGKINRKYLEEEFK